MMGSYMGILAPNQYKARAEGDSISAKSQLQIFEYLMRNLSTARASLAPKETADYVTQKFMPAAAENKRAEIENKPQSTSAFGNSQSDAKKQENTYGTYSQAYAIYKKAKELLYRYNAKAGKIYRDLIEANEPKKKLYEASAMLRKIYNPVRTAKLAERVLQLSGYLKKDMAYRQLAHKHPYERISPRRGYNRGGLEGLLATA